MSKKIEVVSNSVQETQAIAKKFAKCLKKNDCLALFGNFGSGKTTFVKGLAQGLDVRSKKTVSSPSFVILKIYPARLPLYHFDLYRLSRFRDLEDVGFDEFVGSDGVCVLEWAEKVKKFLPKGHIQIQFKMLGENQRRITFYK